MASNVPQRYWINCAGEIYYDFVEVMACKRGCITGGGQPVPIGPRTKKARVEGLYKIDKMAQIKLSSQNPIVATVYDGILKGKEHKLLHNENSIIENGTLLQTAFHFSV